MQKLLGLLLSILGIYLANADDISNKMISNLRLSLPELTIDQVNTTVIPNIYEVVSGRKVFYVDATGRYMILGNVVDLATKQSITQSRVEKLSMVDWKKLPLQLALKLVLGNGQRKIAVFTDPDCPFCRRLEQNTIPQLVNVTVYYFLFPLSIHANAQIDAKKIICSEVPEKTFSDWMRKDIPLPMTSNCKAITNLAIIQDLGKKVIGIEATPTIVLPNGRIVAGLIPADYLNKLINEESATPLSNSLSIK